MTLESLERLREGNRRFVAGEPTRAARSDAGRRAELASGQEPFAAVLGCSDSRVPVEIVFDQGPGDLFVIRVAGNVVTPSGIGSVEFAVERLGTRLVVVLGHTGCGAVEATLAALGPDGEGPASENLRSIVDRIRPAVERLLAEEPSRDREALWRAAVRANVRVSVDRLRRGSDVLERAIDEDGLRIVGAEYSLETGVVDFFEESRPER